MGILERGTIAVFSRFVGKNTPSLYCLVLLERGTIITVSSCF